MSFAPTQDAKTRAAAQAQLDAYNRRDIDSFMCCYAEDVEVYSHGDSKLLSKGRHEMRARYDALFKASPELHCDLKQRIVMGRFAFDEESVTGREGQTEALRVVAIYEVNADGLIAKVWFAKP